jgi:glucose/arabinose dehydrogenase/cytochrome c553
VKVGKVATILSLFLLWLPFALNTQEQDAFQAVYSEACAVCHGENGEGAAQGTPLVGVELKHGESIAELTKSIADGFPDTGMPAWSDTLEPAEIRRLAILISERRSSLAYTDFKIEASLAIPDGVIDSELHDFRVETVASGLDPLPFSIAPLPDGSILLTEKTRGLSIISPDGLQSDLIAGAPQAYDDGFEAPGVLLVYGTGWLLDVALHPDYGENGWIYLSFGDRCTGCNALSQDGRPVSMTKLIRGRIEDGAWTDEEVIWSVDLEMYTPMVDMVAGGRITFDGAGNLFLSVGMKGLANYLGVQDLSLPYGKIHRMRDDGSLPEDNPFVENPNAMATIWTYGHRSPQGLEFDRATGQLWGTEMGPRGGDEVNLLLPGRNYGWPLYSKGLDYDGTPVEYWKELGIELDLDAIEQPVVDLTPSPAVSSFIVYDGSAFPQWRQNLIVGTLKARELYRMVLEEDQVVHRETLLSDFARIRDIETAPDGTILLLIEQASGSRILRLVPEPTSR